MLLEIKESQNQAKEVVGTYRCFNLFASIFPQLLPQGFHQGVRGLFRGRKNVSQRIRAGIHLRNCVDVDDMSLQIRRLHHYLNCFSGADAQTHYVDVIDSSPIFCASI